MAQKKIDEIGNRYGLLTVLKETRDKNNRLAWLCQCDCGNTKVVRGSDLRSGKITTCGKKCALKYTRNGQFKDETGKKYGRLLVLYRNGHSSSNKILWHCRCECGKEIDVVGSDLRNGKTKSCGCLNKEKASDRNFKNEIGNKYGKLTVLELVTKTPKAIWKCQCDCGNIALVRGIDLRSGNTKSCGCLKSYYEETIEKILKKLKVKYIKEYSFEDLKSPSGTKLRFDFALFDSSNILKILIEYNGEQHYMPVDFYGGIQEFKKQQKRDLQKINYCKKNNISLLILNKDSDLEKEINEVIKNLW